MKNLNRGNVTDLQNSQNKDFSQRLDNQPPEFMPTPFIMQMNIGIMPLPNEPSLIIPSNQQIK